MFFFFFLFLQPYDFIADDVYVSFNLQRKVYTQAMSETQFVAT